MDPRWAEIMVLKYHYFEAMSLIAEPNSTLETMSCRLNSLMKESMNQ